MNPSVTSVVRSGVLLAINLLFLMLWGFAGVGKLIDGVPSWFDGKFGKTFMATFPGLTATFWILAISELLAFALAVAALVAGEFLERKPLKLIHRARARGISVIFITHDLGTVGYFADRVAVMYLGRIVEIRTMKDVLKDPQHPYTKALLSVIPVPNPRLRKKRIVLQGETPNPVNLPPGCRFHPRCPLAMDVCKQSDPAPWQVSESHQAACLLLVK